MVFCTHLDVALFLRVWRILSRELQGKSSRYPGSSLSRCSVNEYWEKLDGTWIAWPQKRRWFGLVEATIGFRCSAPSPEVTPTIGGTPHNSVTSAFVLHDGLQNAAAWLSWREKKRKEKCRQYSAPEFMQTGMWGNGHAMCSISAKTELLEISFSNARIERLRPCRYEIRTGWNKGSRPARVILYTIGNPE